MKKNILPVILLAASVILTVISLMLLPQTVITQFSLNGSGTTSMAKPIAVLLPAALGAGGAIAYLLQKSKSYKLLIVSGVGILVFAIMLAVNL